MCLPASTTGTTIYTNSNRTRQIRVHIFHSNDIRKRFLQLRIVVEVLRIQLFLWRYRCVTMTRRRVKLLVYTRIGFLAVDNEYVVISPIC